MFEDLQIERPRGRDHRHLVAHALANQRPPDRRLVRDLPMPRIGLLRPDQVIGLLFTLGIDRP